jgi:uncharacterized protein (TIGR02246 family)
MRNRDVMALATCACLMALPSDAETCKALSPADVRKIDEAAEIAMKAAVAQDFSTWAGLFLEDAAVYPPNQPAVRGRAAIRAWLAGFPPITRFELRHVKVDGCADLAYALGTYTMTIAPPGAPAPIEDSGKFVSIFRRQADGRWLLAVDMFNSDLPAASPPK